MTNGLCVYCGELADTNDHVRPRAYGGSDEEENLVPACRSCNSRKSTLPAELVGASAERIRQWLIERGWTTVSGRWGRMSTWRSPEPLERGIFYSRAAAIRKAAWGIFPPIGRVEPEQTSKNNNKIATKPRARTRYDWGVPQSAAEWTFESRRSGYRRTVPLGLYWELDGDPMSDDWRIEEIGARDLYDQWRRRYPMDHNAEALWGPGAYEIHWFVVGPGVIELAPLPKLRASGLPNFLDSFTWPNNPNTGSLRWTRLPVVDKGWSAQALNDGLATKGGFIQEATGWKPSALQRMVNITELDKMSV